MQLKEFIPEQTSMKDPVTGQGRKGSWTRYDVGIKIKGRWYNSSFFKESDVAKFRQIKENEVCQLVFFDHKYTDKEGNEKTQIKFRFPTLEEKIDARLDKIETLLKKLIE